MAVIGTQRQPESVIDRTMLSPEDQARIAAAQRAWEEAAASHNEQGMKEAHDLAEGIRGRYGYSGGDAGHSFINLVNSVTGGLINAATGTGGNGAGDGSSMPVTNNNTDSSGTTNVGGLFGGGLVGNTGLGSGGGLDFSSANFDKMIKIGVGLMFLMFITSLFRRG